MITHSDVILNLLKEIGKPTRVREIMAKTNVSSAQAFDSLRKLVKNGDVSREYKYTGKMYRGSTVGLLRERCLFWTAN